MQRLHELGYTTVILYVTLGIQPVAVAGQAAEMLPEWLKLGSAILLAGLLVYAYRSTHKSTPEASGGCNAGCCSTK